MPRPLGAKNKRTLAIEAAGKEVMDVLKQAPISYGQKYRHLVIEDLVE